MVTLANRLQKAADKRRLSWAEVARRANVPPGYVRSVGTGHIDKPDPVRLARIAEVLGLDSRELLALTDQLGAVEVIAEPTTTTGLDRLAAAIEAQTAAINALVVALGRSAVERPAWVDEALSEVQDAVLGARLLAPTPRAAGARERSDAPPPDRE